jgi:hypothetical protein
MGSAWWREIVRIRDGVGGLRHGWFGESVTMKVEGGLDTLFWSDPWLGEIPLCERFERLFDLAETKSSTVAEIYSLGGGRLEGGLGVEASVVGVGVGDGEGVSDITSTCDFAG